jgi:hypothetical protein
MHFFRNPSFSQPQLLSQPQLVPQVSQPQLASQHSVL